MLLALSEVEGELFGPCKHRVIEIFVLKLALRRSGGTGRRAALRGLYLQRCGGSSPLVRTLRQAQDALRLMKVEREDEKFILNEVEGSSLVRTFWALSSAG